MLQLPQVFHQINERVVPNVQIHPTVNPITVEEATYYDSSVIPEDADKPPSYQQVILTDFRQEIEPPPSYRESQKKILPIECAKQDL